MNKRIIFLSLLPLIVLVVAGRPRSAASLDSIPPVPLPVWSSEVVAAGPTLAGQGTPGMALGVDDRPHIVFGQSQLFHAWPESTTWRFEMVTTAAGPFYSPAIASDASGKLTIVAAATSITTGEMGLLVVSRAADGAWQTATVALPRIDAAPALSLALDSTGRPHVIVTGRTADGSPALLYAHASPAGWVSETVAIPHAPRGQLALALDSQDRPVVLYEIGNQPGPGATLSLARRDAAGWHHQTVGVGLILVGKSLALDAGDRAHVVFGDNDPTQLVYRWETEDGWQTLIEPGKGFAPNLALDETGQPHLVYVGQNNHLIYATLGDGFWRETWLREAEPAGGHNTLRLDSAGVAHIAVLHEADGLTYITNPNDYWRFDAVAKESAPGRPQALVLDAADRPYLLAYNSTVQQLYWAVKDGDRWTKSFVASPPPTGLEIAAAIGPDGVAQIAYVDSERDQLVAGARPAGQWLLTPITTAGRGLQLAVGQDNQPHLILIQNDQLNYWTKDNGAWHSEPISPDGGVVYFAHLALDSQGRPKVFYDREGSEQLNVAVRQSDGDWAATTLPFRPFLAMALGPDDAAYGLYVTNRFEGGKPPTWFIRLNMAEQAGNEWQSSGFDETFPMEDPDGRLLVDAEGRVHVLERNGAGVMAYHQRDADGQWLRESLFGLGGFALALGSDGQPRVSGTFDNDLRLYRRSILWLDEHVLLPAVPHPGW
ncbi:MAG: hypothetical protein K1X50_06155 [Candidatus Promineofilum sp.]|nr:hypothetical protein [Promineifilum sp.]MCW5863922.1 hypothetical protein [Anaerolineae bacterium]